MKFSQIGLLGWLSTCHAQSAIQSGPNIGSIFSAGMVYSETKDEILLTGITYDSSFGDDTLTGQASPESSCVVAKVSLPDMKWEHGAVFGSPQVLEACRSLALLNNDIMVVVGTSEPGGLFAGNDKVQFGFGMAIKRDSLTALSGASLFADQVSYPVDIVAEGMDIYVTSMTSNSNQENSIPGQYPNWTWRNKYGSNFEMTVKKLSLSLGPSPQGLPNSTMSFSSQWTHHFHVDPLSDGTKPTVYVAGMILKNNEFLVVAGSTRALGDGYGPADGDDEDGYITLLDPATGKLLQNERYGTAEDDVVSGVCDDPNDPTSIYIVGATKGDNDGIQDDELDITPGSLQGFISKINMATLYERWTVQWGAQNADLVTSNYALGCHVEAGVVYVAGVVENNAGMVQGQDVLQSQGGDDIWVAQLVGDDGTVNWIEQVGTPGDDHLARGGGITSDKRGNAIVFGDTTGALYRERDTNSLSDLFVMTLDHEDGHYAMTGAAVSPPAARDPAPAPTNPDSSPTEPAPVATNISDDILDITWGIAALFAALVAVAFFFVSRARKQKKDERQKTSVFAHLQQFKVDAIDLRKSPPGGWHGTYTNKLAHGINSSLYSDYPPLVPDHDDDMYDHICFDYSNSLYSVTQDDSVFFHYGDDPLVGMHHKTYADVDL
jgi:hypothetical protein